MTRILLLGGLCVEVHGKRFETFPRRKAAALLALLALRPQQRHAREELAVQLWPDADTETGRRNLRQTLLYLRQALPEQELVHADSHALWLAEGTTTDVATFEAALLRGEGTRARSLWRGELLPGFFEEAILTERERLNALLAQVPAAGIPAPSPRAGLPLYLSELQGRESELERLSLLLSEPGVRLITLLGPGGVGKTRLAVALAAGMKHDVVFVELAALSSGSGEERLLQSIIEALGLSLHGEEPREESLLRLMASRNLLLILDNAEHVLPATSALVLRLLRAAPRLKLVVTSREPLRVEGERTLALQPLDPTVAARFLRTSARAVRPDLPDDPEALRQICAQLEGLPLALELAASQCRSLSLRELAQDLSEGFGLGETASASLPTRQRSLEATLAWSEALLVPEQRALLYRLAVFAGGAERAAVLEICQARRESLAALVEKSLVQAQIQPDGTTRYRFLEPIRQWCVERLERSGEAPELRQRHAHWYLVLAEKAAPELRRAEQHLWLKKLDKEQANLLATWPYLTGQESLRLAVALGQYWQRRGLLTEGIQRTEQALAGVLEPSEVRFAALLVLGTLYSAAGDSVRGRACLTEAAQAQSRTIAIEATLALSTDSKALTYESYWASIQPILEETRGTTWGRWHHAQALLQVESFLDSLNDHAIKLERVSQATALFEAEGDLHKVMEGLYSLVGVHLVQQNFVAAAPLLQRLQETAALLESTYIEVLTLSMQMRAQRARPHPEPGALRTLVERLVVLAPRLGVPSDAFNAWHDLLQASRHLALWGQAQHALGQMLHFRQRNFTRPILGVYLLGAVGSFLADIGETERGGRLYGYLLETREQLGALPNPLEQRVYERDLACLRAPDPEGLERALAEGRQLSFEQALALAQQPLALPPDGTAPLLPPI
ncbi:ATP-binding protein [Armatimonas rosea]|uniref:Putative ATPase n=1 Tax=Armatimonas rosea TaxID=685828 RepID=A0A7W9SKY1_ARMRO|nr:AAA family ATPase [Armatimonas rosea]MBB6048250.1 putative ATPase [Armatimonas rosea]